MRKLLLLSLLLMFIHFKEGSAQCTSNPTVTGNFSPCLNTNEVYSTEAGMTNYSWTVAGGTISTGQSTNSISVNWNSTSSPSVGVTYTNSASCTSGTLMPVVVKPTALASISGPSSFCSGTNVTYTAPSGMQNYSWSFPVYTPGIPYPPAYATVVSGINTNAITVYWTTTTPFPNSPPGAIGPWNTSFMSVSYLDPSGNGCLSKGSLNGPITAPPATASISGTTSICSVTSNIYNYSASNLTMPAINYQWTVTGGTIVSGQGSTSIGVVWSATGSQQVSFRYTGAISGCTSNSAILNVNVNAQPTPLSLSGPTTSCAGSTVTYTTDPGKSNYVWTVSSPGTITSGQGTNTLNVYWKAGGIATVSVNYNVNGCYPPSNPTLNVTVGGATIAGPSMVCPGALGSAYSTEAGNTNYAWTISGGTIASGQGTNSVTVNWGATGGSIGVSYTGTNNGCTGSTPATMNVGVSVVPIPTIIGPTSVCTNVITPFNSNIPYASYNWSVSPTGIIQSPNSSTSNMVMVMFNYNPGNIYSISLSGRDNNGCTSATVTKNVLANTGLSSTLTPSPVCSSSPFTYIPSSFNTGATFSWSRPGVGGIIPSSSSGSGVVSEVLTNTTPQPVNATYNYVTYVSGMVSCQQGVVVPVKQSIITPGITGNASVCANSIQSYSVTNTAGSTYSWTITGGTLVSGGSTNSIIVNWGAAGTGNVRVVETSSSGCVGVAVNKSVIINALPSTSAITGNAGVCANTSGQSYSVTNTAGSIYTWTITGGTQASGGNTNSITVNWGTAGTGNVSVTETNSLACVGAPVNKPITIYGLLATSAITGNVSVCANANGISYSVTNTAGSTYAWTVTGGTIASGGNTNSITVNWGAAGSGNVSVMETNSSGCSGIAVNKPVTINALPSTSAITGNASLCANSNGVSYSVTNTAGSTYTWTITGGTQVSGGNTNSITVNWGAAGTGNVSAIETNSLGCIGIAVNKSITINALPSTSTITGNAGVCANASGQSYSVTSTAGSTYAWTITGGTQASGGNTNSITVNWGAGTSGNVSVTETNSFGCIGTAVNKSISIYALLATSAITGNASVCANSVQPYSLTTTAGSTYTWTITGGTIVSGGNSNSVIVNWGAAGYGNISVIETNSSGCTGIAVSKLITINPLPSTSAISGNGSVCVNSNGQAYSVTNTAGSIYTWTITGGTQASGGNTNSITVNWGAAGTGNVSVTETNSFGCVGTAVNKSISIYILATSAIIGNASVCVNANGIPYSVTNTAGSTYAWTITGGSIGSGGNTNSITVNWGAAGQGSVNVVETNPSGCVGALVSKPITINALPLASISASGSTTFCQGGSVTLSAYGGSSYLWSTGATTQSIVVTAGGNYFVTVTNSYGCSVMSPSIPIIVNPLPNVSISPEVTTICPGLSTILYASGASTYSWSNGSTAASITVRPLNTTTYTVTGSANGCSASASSTITVKSAYGYVTPSNVDLCTTGGCATLQAGPGSGYHWSFGPYTQSISVCSPGTYTVTYTMNGCSVSASAYVYRSTSTSPAISIQAVDNVKEGTNYLQSMSIDPSLQSGLTSQVIAPTPCQELVQQAITVEDTRSFSYYPNPASKEVTIILTKVAVEDLPVLWFDMSGRQVKTSTIEKGNKEKTFQIDELDAGVYLVRVKDNGQLRYSKILVNK